MKRIFLILCCCVLLAAPARADKEHFSVLTCSPGDEAYSLFGHTALRYVNAGKGIDVVFNYGYFDFDSPDFMWRFIMGDTDYWVGAVPFDCFIPEYAERGSEVAEQVLNLSPEQEAHLLSALLKNTRRENRVFRYNYFSSNCTTKARDILLGSLGDGCTIAYNAAPASPSTLRENLALKTAAHPWYAFGVDVILGSDIDREASREERQFVPSNLMTDFANASIVGKDGSRVPLVKATNIIARENKPAPAKSNFTPFNASLLLLIFTLVVMLCELRKKKTYWGWDILLMLMQGAAGCMILFMWIFSQHPAVDANYAIILLNPLALLLMPIMVYRIIRHKSPVLAWVQTAFVLLFFLSAVTGLQSYPAPLYFCALALLSRSLFHIYKERICELNIV